MPLSERSYLRGYSNYFPQGVKWLLIVNTAIFVVFFFAVHSGYDSLFLPFYLSPREVLSGLAVWQLVTYMFLHDPFGFSHIRFNMLTLWMAGICVVVANLLFGNPNARTIGASGAIYGLLLAYGMLFPDRQVLFSFLFPMKAKYFVMILGAIAFLSSFAAPGGPVSHLAHLGGMLFGYVYIRSERGARPKYAAARRTSFVASAREWYHEWRLQRARRKFQVYMRKREEDRDRFVH
jgi:membrane associated rhomboid family serine protease